MKNIPEKIISIIFHPLLLPSYAILLIFSIPTQLQIQLPFSYQKAIFIIIFLMTFLAPLFSILIMRNTNIISDITMESKNERFYPYAVTTSFYLATYVVLSKYNIHQYITLLMLLSSIANFITMLITFKFKISAHLVSMGVALSYGIYFLMLTHSNIFYFLIIILLISSITAYARLKLNAHSPKEVYLGFLLGIIISIFLFYVN